MKKDSGKAVVEGVIGWNRGNQMEWRRKAVGRNGEMQIAQQISVVQCSVCVVQLSAQHVKCIEFGKKGDGDADRVRKKQRKRVEIGVRELKNIIYQFLKIFDYFFFPQHFFRTFFFPIIHCNFSVSANIILVIFPSLSCQLSWMLFVFISE